MNFRATLAIILLSLSCISARGQKYDRGYDNAKPVTFAPKKSFMVSGTAKFSCHTMDDYKFLIIDDINSNGYTISVNPNFLYMIRDNIGVGLSFSYGRTLLDMESANMSMSEISMSVNDYYRLSQSFTGALAFRPYIPLGKSGRFSLFAQVELGFSTTTSKNTASISSDPKGTFTNKYKILLGVNPGISAFITNHFAIEASVGILGFNYTWANQKHNQVANGSHSLSDASLMLNLATLSLGLAYYL